MDAPPPRQRAWVGIEVAPRDVYREALELSAEQQRRDYSIDLNPILDHALDYVHAAGIPLRPAPELADSNGIAFAAAWRISSEMPAVKLHIGDSGPLDAFYPTNGGFRWSFTWPMPGAPRVAFHLEGGEETDFGYWAIVGMQWRDSKRPLAVGIGLPFSMTGAHGPVGFVCELRMLLD